jgi:hypothetical protein
VLSWVDNTRIAGDEDFSRLLDIVTHSAFATIISKTKSGDKKEVNDGGFLPHCRARLCLNNRIVFFAAQGDIIDSTVRCTETSWRAGGQKPKAPIVTLLHNSCNQLLVPCTLSSPVKAGKWLGIVESSLELRNGPSMVKQRTSCNLYIGRIQTVNASKLATDRVPYEKEPKG